MIYPPTGSKAQGREMSITPTPRACHLRRSIGRSLTRWPRSVTSGSWIDAIFAIGQFLLCRCLKIENKKFKLMLTRRAKAYNSSGSVVTHRSTNRARRRVTSFQSKRITNYAMPPTPVLWRHLVNDLDLRSPKSLKSLMPAC